MPVERDQVPPRPVRLASFLLFVCAALAALDALAAILALQHLADAAPAFLKLLAEEGRVDEYVVPGIRSALVNIAVVAVGAVLLLVPLAFAARRPWPAARIAAWCVGLTLCYAWAIGIGTGPEPLTLPSGVAPAEEYRAALQNLLPAWFSWVRGVVVTGQVAGTVAAALLLLRTSASDFYRRQDGPAGLYTFARDHTQSS